MAQAGASPVLATEEQAAAEVLKVLGRRWTFLILHDLEKDAMRFNELKRSLAGITSTVLSDRLLELEREGLVVKSIVQGKTDYSLTASARELQVMLREVGRWRARRVYAICQ